MLQCTSLIIQCMKFLFLHPEEIGRNTCLHYYDSEITLQLYLAPLWGFKSRRVLFSTLKFSSFFVSNRRKKKIDDNEINYFHFNSYSIRISLVKCRLSRYERYSYTDGYSSRTKYSRYRKKLNHIKNSYSNGECLMENYNMVFFFLFFFHIRMQKKMKKFYGW